MKFLLKGLSVVFILSSSFSVHAVTDQFSISQRVVIVDSSAPSTPLGLVANGVALTQVTLTWSASTDNVGVAGYQVFRDGLQIATSATPTYSDTGLSPSTSYGYFVRAFDNALNISADSAIATGTTLSVVVAATTTTTDPSGGGRVAVRIADLRVIVSDFSAKVSWRTNLPTKSLVRWGRSPEYEIASLKEDLYSEEHGTQLSNLEPGTKYYYAIIAEDGVGRERVLVKDFFVTQDSFDEIAPPNVSTLRAYRENGQSILTWKNPEVSDFEKVRVVRRQGGYPSDPFDGELVYEGRKQIHKELVSGDTKGVMHYAVFSYDAKGNVSSGALVKFSWGDAPALLVEEISPYASSTVFRFQDLIFMQGGTQISYIGETVPISSAQPLSIQIPSDSLSQHLKTILVVLQDPEDSTQTFTFLLKINKEKTFYEAVVDALGENGSYPVSVTIFDYKERTISKVKGQLLVQGGLALDDGDKAFDTSLAKKIFEVTARLNYIPWIFSLMLFLAVLYLLATRGSKERG